MQRITDLAHMLLRPVLHEGALAVDATVGNGHDTRMLAEAVGVTGRVFGFDVQQAALDAAAERLRQCTQVTLIRRGHEHLTAALPPEAHQQLAAVVFNLGYLPGGDKTVTTTAATTTAALGQALFHLRIGGRAVVVLYPGHRAGALEAEAVREFARTLPSEFAATHCARSNAATPAPELIVIDRVR